MAKTADPAMCFRGEALGSLIPQTFESLASGEILIRWTPAEPSDFSSLNVRIRKLT